jgi:hypothetical protein
VLDVVTACTAVAIVTVAVSEACAACATSVVAVAMAVFTACCAGLTTTCSAGGGTSLAWARSAGENIIHNVKNNPTNPDLISMFLIFFSLYSPSGGYD